MSASVNQWYKHPFWVLMIFLPLGALVAYLDHQWQFQTMLVETIHALIVTGILVFCWLCQRRYPDVKQYGWTAIVWGVAFLTIGSWVDLLDDPPALKVLTIHGIPFGRSWEQAFLKKILGYSGGIALIAYGFFQWIPWMIKSRLDVQHLNTRLSDSNQKLSRILRSLDDHIEADRLSIARELHDEVAQELTSLNLQLQLCQREIIARPEQAAERLNTVGSQVKAALQSVRDISRNLRSDSLVQLGFLTALDQFIDKLKVQYPELSILLSVGEHADAIRQFTDANYSESQQLHLLRIIQEAIRNAIKHSGASIIETRIHCEPLGAMTVQVLDNGKGLPWTTLPSDNILVQAGHLGLVGLKERVAELGGAFSFHTLTAQAGSRQPGACLEVRLCQRD